MKRLLATAVLIGAVLAASGAIVGCTADTSRSSERDSTPTVSPQAAADATAAFFSSYVSSDGRVVRHDQGGDTVSEGQAYAMLLAVAADDAARFDSIWSWTREHLQRNDGLVSWRWQDGLVPDANSATDADLDVARALMLAAAKFGQESYAVEGRRIATAVLDHETIQVASGVMLVAGPWATADRVVNPSYLARCDFDEFARTTSDARWTQVRTASYELLGALIGDGLPPDWIVVDSAGRARAVAGPDDRQGPGRYGLDAARIPARLAGCDEGRGLAAALWPRLQALERDGAALAYAIDGRRLEESENALGLVASALSANAAGDTQEAQRRMDAARRLEEKGSTYYGSAWLALGTDLLAAHGSGASVLRAVPWVGSLRFAARGLAVSAQATTTPPATTIGTSTSQTSTATSSTVSASTRPATTVPATSGATTRPATTLGPTTRPSTAPPSTTAAVNAPVATQPPSGGETGDLSSPENDLPITQRGAPRATAVDTPEESSRRRTGAITIGGVSVVAALGVVLGLRERAIVRRRPA